MSSTKFELKGIGKKMFVYEDKVTFKAKGLLGFLELGGQKTLPISKITSIQLHTGNILSRGFIELSILGGLENSGGLFSSRNSENTIYFKNKHRKQAEAITEYLERIILNKDKASNIQSSAADEITKFKKLLDQGIITEDEFLKKKNELLGI